MTRRHRAAAFGAEVLVLARGRDGGKNGPISRRKSAITAASESREASTREGLGYRPGPDLRPGTR